MDSLGIVIKRNLVIKDNKDSLGIIIKRNLIINKGLYFILDNELKY